MNSLQNMLQTVEVGKGQALVRIIPLAAAILVIGLCYNISLFHGLNDAQSMDNAQLARQIFRGQGFTTEFLRPHAIAQLHDYAASESVLTGGHGDLFPANVFAPGVPRILPDTYNAPGYPYLLAAWFHIVHPEFTETPAAMGAAHIYAGDRWIPPLNQMFLLLTAVLVFILGLRLFDARVAWFSLVAFFATDLVWHYSMTALSTTFLMFLVTAVLICAVEIVCVGEACFESEARSFAPAWLWAFALALFLAVACLTRLPLLVLLVPLFVLLLTMPQARVTPVIFIALVVFAFVAPWFLHVDKVSGSLLGSNLPLVLQGQGGYTGNQIFCTTSIPKYEQLFSNVSSKEYSGFRWHFEHAWNLLGANPLILLFAASTIHQFKRRRARSFQWLLVGSALFLIAINNLATPSPDAMGASNILFILFPGMIVIGGAFFFILLDRLNIQIALLNTLIVTTTLIITVFPLVLTVTVGNASLNGYPPYLPPLIKILAQYSQPDEWVTSDIPWATAWYGDRPSLWMPDSIADFESFQTNYCPTGMLILTPASWSKPVETFKTGEYKDWLPFVTDAPVPENFPLAIHPPPLPGSGYSFWSDRPRWETK